jgi:hypothetical protein
VDRVVKNWGKVGISSVIGAFSPLCLKNKQKIPEKISLIDPFFWAPMAHFIRAISLILSLTGRFIFDFSCVGFLSNDDPRVLFY